MCGFAGYVGGTLSGAAALSVLDRMAGAIAHRGPDDSGSWLEDGAPVGLAHRRLSVVDLSAAGHQPMVSSAGHLVLVFNGEIYNHQELRRELALHGRTGWRGHSDTETLLAGFEEWGVSATLRKAVGMFGFALWDRRERLLHLARDRIGEKPVYYGWQGADSVSRTFVFASEVRALENHPAFGREVPAQAMREFVKHGNIPGTGSIYRGIHKLTPGCVLTLALESGRVVIEPYWSLLESVAQARPLGGLQSQSELLSQLDGHLARSVRQQMLADVPVGAFLSGGVDSSLVTALMCRESPHKVKTFSVGFENESYNEAPYAEAVARHLGTDHTEICLAERDAIDFVPRLSAILDEPFADSSLIPTYFVSRLARGSVTVALSGDAGDELFGGYNRYLFTAALWSRFSSLPVGLRGMLGSMLRALAPALSDRHNFLIPTGLRLAGLAEKAQKASSILASSSLEDVYMGLLPLAPDAAGIMLPESDSSVSNGEELGRPAGLSDPELMMFWDSLRYLPDDILVKVDRAAMAVSLETRIPLLDHRLVEFAWSLPVDMKIRKVGSAHETKWALRQILYKHVPRDLIERPKKGFAVPVGDWIRGPLRTWAEELLSRKRLEATGIFDTDAVHRVWLEHLQGRRDWQHKLWNVLMLQDWLQEGRSGGARTVVR